MFVLNSWTPKEIGNGSFQLDFENGSKNFFFACSKYYITFGRVQNTFKLYI